MDDNDSDLLTDEDDYLNESVTLVSEDSSDTHTNQPTYEMYTLERLLEFMDSLITDVGQIINFPRTYLRILLAKYKWDKHRLIESYFDSGEEKFLKEANLVFPKDAKNTTSTSKSVPTPNQNNSFSTHNNIEMCDICYVSTPAVNMVGLDCCHRFCTDCWKLYLKHRIIDENQVDQIYCPAHLCCAIADDSLVYSLATGDIVQKFKLKIARNFIHCNPLLEWCPGKQCDRIVCVQRPGSQRIDCDSCGAVFCFHCSENWHDPVKCNLLERWLRKMRDDSETSNWIVANTKECPRCRATIEKNGGCNHMICKNASCKYEFCWVCLDQWEPHGSAWYNCNRYNEADAQRARGAQEASRAALQRYLFYFNRYANHMQSLRFESKLYTGVQKKMEEMQSHNMSWIEVQFLKQAVDVLCDCRRTLKFTYVFAYYLKRNNQSIIFESNQSDLEQSTEQLSEYLERDITTDSLVDIKQRVQDKTRYCKQRRSVLLSHVHEGYENEWWEHLNL